MRKAVTALLFCCAWAMAAAPPPVAIRNARIVTVGGPVLSKGTVVLRNGLIEAVGENVPAPPDAAVVEGEGLTVYPGLIDALSTWGLPGAAAATGGRGAAAGRGATPVATPAQTPAAASSRGPEDRPSTTSWVKAADEIQPSDRRIETARNAGFATAVTFPTRGIFAGQGSVVDLISTEHSGEMVVLPAVGQYLSLASGGRGMGGGFPGSTMGVIAYIRQVYLDAQHYALVKDAYARDPRSMPRPAYDRALEGVTESKRILLPATRLVEIDRMLRFAAELKQPAIFYGMREAYRPEALELLKKANAPVLVSLRWPEPPRDADPDDVESLRALQTRDLAPSAPALLKKAGVPFALYSDGLDAPRDLQRAVKKAIDAGLAREDALYRPTHGPEIPEPKPYVEAFIAHRREREGEILKALAASDETPAIAA
ncbi:MAG: amidohydrolase, partial [Acidobacteriia bacterium]|nr:amidohydrolase [Terriglobia bacterium]